MSSTGEDVWNQPLSCAGCVHTFINWYECSGKKYTVSIKNLKNVEIRCSRIVAWRPGLYSREIVRNGQKLYAKNIERGSHQLEATNEPHLL